MRITFGPNQTPKSANQIKAFTMAQTVKKEVARLGELAKELDTIEGVDLDGRDGHVLLEKHELPTELSSASKASGTAEVQDGELQSLSLFYRSESGEHKNQIRFQKYHDGSSGSIATIDGSKVFVTESPNGTLTIDDQVFRDVETTISDARPATTAEKAKSLMKKSLHAAAGAVLGATPLGGLIFNGYQSVFGKNSRLKEIGALGGGAALSAGAIAGFVALTGGSAAIITGGLTIAGVGLAVSAIGGAKCGWDIAST